MGVSRSCNATPVPGHPDWQEGTFKALLQGGKSVASIFVSSTRNLKWSTVTGPIVSPSLRTWDGSVSQLPFQLEAMALVLFFSYRSLNSPPPVEPHRGSFSTLKVIRLRSMPITSPPSELPHLPPQSRLQEPLTFAPRLPPYPLAFSICTFLLTSCHRDYDHAVPPRPSILHIFP